jgi:hypothetical protein
MVRSDPDGAARRRADAARPLLGAEGFGGRRTDELASTFLTDHVGEGGAQFLGWARAEGPVGLDPEVGL